MMHLKGLLALLATAMLVASVAAGDAAPQTFSFKGPSYGYGNGNGKGNGNGNDNSVASAIVGLWAGYQAINVPQPLAFATATIEGITFTITGVWTANDTPFVAVGQYVGGGTSGKPGNGRRGGLKGGNGSGYNGGYNGGNGNGNGNGGSYPTYKAYVGGSVTGLTGWWTFVLYDKDTVVPYQGENPTIPNPPTPAPGQLIFKRYSIE